MIRIKHAFAIALVALASCEDNAPKFVDAACSPAAITAVVVSPTSYACMAPYRATVTVTNGGCTALTISGVTITGAVTAGACAPSSPFTYPPTRTSIASGASAQVLDLTGGMFCCNAPGCPAQLTCSETFTIVVDTSAGPITTSSAATLELGGCSVVCTAE